MPQLGQLPEPLVPSGVLIVPSSHPGTAQALPGSRGSSSTSRPAHSTQESLEGIRDPRGMQGPQRDAGSFGGCREPWWDAGIPIRSRDPGRAASGPSVLCGNGFLWLLPFALPCLCLPNHSCCTDRFSGKFSLDSSGRDSLMCAGYWGSFFPTEGCGKPEFLHCPAQPQWRQLWGQGCSCSPSHTQPGQGDHPSQKQGLVENKLMGLLQPSLGVCSSSCLIAKYFISLKKSLYK